MNPIQHILKKHTRPAAALTAAVIWGLTAPIAATAPDSHAGHDHEADAGAHQDEAAEVKTDTASRPGPADVPVTREQVERLGIKIATAVTGTVRRDIRVPGEIRIDADHVAHVVPRASGVVREVLKTLGDEVRAGETLAWIESGELAQAKLDFYAKESEVGCCKIRLPRAKEIFESVARLITLLEQGGNETGIQELDELEMGTYRGKLLTAYAAYRAAETVHAREVELRAKGISSGDDMLTAQTALRQAKANFLAAVDTARFETLMAYTEATQEQQLAEFDAVAAEQQLRLKGGDREAVESLRALIPKNVGAAPCLCDDPNCKVDAVPSVSTTLGQDKRFAWSHHLLRYVSLGDRRFGLRKCLVVKLIPLAILAADPAQKIVTAQFTGILVREFVLGSEFGQSDCPIDHWRTGVEVHTISSSAIDDLDQNRMNTLVNGGKSCVLICSKPT